MPASYPNRLQIAPTGDGDLMIGRHAGSSISFDLLAATRPAS